MMILLPPFVPVLDFFPPLFCLPISIIFFFFKFFLAFPSFSIVLFLAVTVQSLISFPLSPYLSCCCVCAGGQEAGPWLRVHQEHSASQRWPGCQ